ncbi:IclR family transcriptional regulator [Microbaculum marinisediminis]|uniref:IclR family transcriptional regulator n=1 Tax=Microbaculum marinisediminis TaxID=2931392 RepID=A0AAW5R4Y0_9HYPH|nr:IclR family transcriptional regulator [Microbaculum sp. A6E488]MCT8973595.1 IclR family transcriptional regulator [Microbaculum sp. A6E488]
MSGDRTVQSVQRAADILKLLAGEPTAGWRLSDIARASGLGKATTHRLLSALSDAGFVYQSPETRRYLIGYALVRLVRQATRFNIGDLARPSLLRLARETEDTVFLSVREGLDALCLEREVGAFPIKTLTLDAGDRRPLGVGAGSLALLAFLPQEEVAEVIASNAPRLGGYPRFGPAELAALVEETRRRGYSFNEGRIVTAMCAVGVPVFDLGGRVVASISVAAIRERMDSDRIAWIVSRLKAEADSLQARLGGPAGPTPVNGETA